jgi:SH3 domain-containing YSC84-like protein 1
MYYRVEGVVSGWQVELSRAGTKLLGKEETRMRRCVCLVVLTLCATMLAWAASAERSKEGDRLEKATLVIHEIMQTPDNSVPQDLLDRAVCVGIVPSELKFAFVFGGNYGRGALVCRRGGDGPWGAPSMFTVGGGSWGLQLGGESTDIVFIVMNTDGVRKLLQHGIRLGADASVAGGPVGRTSSAATDVQMHAEILSYSRARGLFAGLSLAGAVLRQDDDGNRHLYGRSITPEEILIDGKAEPPAAAKSLDEVLTKYSPRGGSAFGKNEPSRPPSQASDKKPS